MGEGKTVEHWDGWTADMKAKHGNGNGHGKSLAIEAQRLLPTPSVADSQGGHERRGGARGNELLLNGVVKAHAAGELLLPTPCVDESRCVQCGCPEELHDAGGFCAGRCGGEICNGREFVARLLPTPVTDPDSANGHARDLGSEARLLPTPTVQHTARNSTAGRSPDAKPFSVGDTLADVAYADKWGNYAPAIRRWEQIHVAPAPAATQTSAKGNPQLSPRFTEWLMGLAPGWITDVPEITRNEALKACGNGVVPQQGAAALRWLLRVMAEVTTRAA